MCGSCMPAWHLIRPLIAGNDMTETVCLCTTMMAPMLQCWSGHLCCHLMYWLVPDLGGRHRRVQTHHEGAAAQSARPRKGLAGWRSGVCYRLHAAHWNRPALKRGQEGAFQASSKILNMPEPYHWLQPYHNLSHSKGSIALQPKPWTLDARLLRIRKVFRLEARYKTADAKAAIRCAPQALLQGALHTAATGKTDRISVCRSLRRCAATWGRENATGQSGWILAPAARCLLPPSVTWSASWQTH